jgi:magnesium-transporting ATPase (P-type)
MTPKNEKAPNQIRVTESDETPNWHALPLEEAFRRLEGHTDGLSGREAEERLKTYGPNRLRPPETRGPLARFLQQFHNVLIYVLIAAGVVTALLGHWVDTAVIFGVVIINAIIGFI